MEGFIIERYKIDYSLKNGLGKPSVSLYLTGCDKPIKCKGCHNYELQDESKEKYNIEKIKKTMNFYINKAKEYNSDIHVSYLGGEPLTKYNRNIMLEISNWVKNNFNKVTTVLYSWRKPNQIQDEYVDYIDYGVLGAYMKEKHKEDQIPASDNQIIYDFNKKEEIEPIKLN